MPQKVGIVGAGLSAVVAARELVAAGCTVHLWEKSRGVGGRLAQRRAADGLHFDHGAQYFTVRDPAFATQVAAWRAAGVVEPWNEPIVTLRRGEVLGRSDHVERWVGVPSMNVLAKSLAEGLDVRLQTRVARIERTPAGWTLWGDDRQQLESYDVVIVSAPAPQTSDLLAAAAPDLAALVRRVEVAPCWALMAALDRPLGVDWAGAFVHDSPLAWIACNSRKPGRPLLPEAWVLHASAEWSRAHLEADVATIEPLLWQAWGDAVGRELPDLSYCTAHRWRYALPTEPLADRALWDATMQIGACGDWCGGPRVEGAYLSGRAVAERLLADR
jgi:predicted NAD/FAD-dependent oxidoreductase